MTCETQYRELTTIKETIQKLGSFRAPGNKAKWLYIVYTTVKRSRDKIKWKQKASSKWQQLQKDKETPVLWDEKELTEELQQFKETVFPYLPRITLVPKKWILSRLKYLKWQTEFRI